MAFYRNRKKRLGDILIEASAINEDQLVQALTRGRENQKKLGENLVEMGFTTEEGIARALASQLHLEYVEVANVVIDEELSSIIDEITLRKHIMFPYKQDEENANLVYVAMADPMDMLAIDDFSIITNLQVSPVVSTTRDILLAIDKNYGNTEAVSAANEYAKEREQIMAAAMEEGAALDKEVQNSPIVQLVDSMIEQAARQRASDIHIEALENRVRVRFRIDGVLFDKFTHKISLLPAIITRLKIIGGMDISEKRKPQDGRITKVINLVEYDIRVSILPTVYGEKCVMRLAQKKALTRDKASLGFADDELKQFDAILKNTNGIFLVTGPTGSGKSTTLYTALSELNRDEVNIVTVEDPVEANIDGVNQVQVNPKADLTFATALRSILRQDPDIIMIGEIRDGETAQIAVQASITGHLVVSTLHTNSSTATLARLVDMGVERYLLADSLIGIMAQRLVRTLCDDCKEAYSPDDDEKRMLEIMDGDMPTIYRAKKGGCPNCDGAGYIGRTGIYEIMTVTPRIKAMINSGATADELKIVAEQEGMHTLRESARRLVLKGKTSYKEMMRVTYFNEGE